MYSTVLSAAIHGLEVTFVQVEADVSNGLPMIHMIGYLSSEVREAAERVRTAIQNTGFTFPAKKVVINLSPADVRKRGTLFDVPIAISILSSLGYVPTERITNMILIGELGLNGTICKVSGILPIVIAAKQAGYSACILPKENVSEGRLVPGIQVFGVSTLLELCTFLNGTKQLDVDREEADWEEPSAAVDFSEIRGQEFLKRAAEIAAAGNHNVLLIGPPGSGKTMIAKRIPTILPPMTEEECIEVTQIYSILGQTNSNCPLIRTRPFRSPHHTSTKTALIGGGIIPKPGEISMANHGVLFLDELSEFSRQVLDALRQPMEERKIELTRKVGTYRFPANFMLVAATNPCLCGYYPTDRCTCTLPQIQQFQSHMTQPFLDRIDLCAEASPITYQDLTRKDIGESSKMIRERVCLARSLQYERYGFCKTNAELTEKEVENYCMLGKAEEIFMRQIYEHKGLTARTYHKVLKVARTIADLEPSEEIRLEHLREAVGYRTLEKKRREE